MYKLSFKQGDTVLFGSRKVFLAKAQEGTVFCNGFIEEKEFQKFCEVEKKFRQSDNDIGIITADFIMSPVSVTSIKDSVRYVCKKLLTEKYRHDDQ
jgi:hypothetical protein